MVSSMMIVATQFLWLLVFVCSVFAISPPSNPSSKPGYNPPTTLYQNIASELNISSPQNAVLDVKCSGNYFGFNPSIVDCGAAKEIITPDTAQHLFGERHTGLGDDVFPLPFRVMGGKLLQRWLEPFSPKLPQTLNYNVTEQDLQWITKYR